MGKKLEILAKIFTLEIGYPQRYVRENLPHHPQKGVTSPQIVNLTHPSIISHPPADSEYGELNSLACHPF